MKIKSKIASYEYEKESTSDDDGNLKLPLLDNARNSTEYYSDANNNFYDQFNYTNKKSNVGLNIKNKHFSEAGEVREKSMKLDDIKNKEACKFLIFYL